MTGYSAFHLALFGFSLLMTGVLVAAALAFRAERSLRWVALAFFGFAVLDVGLAGSSVGAGTSLGPRAPWLLVAYFAAVPCFSGLLRSGWSLAQVPMTRWRRWFEAVLQVIAFAMFLAVVWEVVRANHPAPTYEEVLLGKGRFLSKVLVAAVAASLVDWNVEALLALRRKNPAGWPMVIGGVLAFAVIGVTVRQGAASGAPPPTSFGATGAAYLLFAAGAGAVRAFQLARLNSEGALSGYRVLRRVASGGMGDLYLAARVGPAGFQHLVAIKRIREGDANPELVERFLAEGRIAARLSHPHIVDVHDIGRVEGGWFIAMEYIAGVSLRELLKQCSKRGIPVPLTLAVSSIEQASQGLATAHAAGIVHRDVKPDNLMLSFDGTVKVVDFGIAKQMGRDENTGPVGVSPPSPETRAGDVVGTLQYMSPERLRGEPAAPASDVYGLGAVLYELLSGARLTPDDVDPKAFVTGKWRPVPLRTRRGDLPEALLAVVERATAPEPSERFAAADALAAALQPIREALTFTDPGAFVRELFAEAWAEHRALVAGVLPEASLEPMASAPTTATVAERPLPPPGSQAETRSMNPTSRA